MTDEIRACPICRTGETKATMDGDTNWLTCPRCGKFALTPTAYTTLQGVHRSDRVIANASSWIRENQGTKLSSTDLEQLWNLRTPPIAERAVKVLQELERLHPEAGDVAVFHFPFFDPSWLAISWSTSHKEVVFLLTNYLRDEMEALAGQEHTSIDGKVDLRLRITPHGFKLLDELRYGSSESSVGFCAMWFSDDLKPLWTEAIEPAIRDAGYEPKRIDQHEHVNRIDDEIVAMIRRSRFVVADFTGQRGGVYFEAGYALGLERRVIWTCREDELPKVHFDTRQYNFLKWKPGEYGDLKRRLQNRIEATLGRGSIKTA